MGGGRGGRTEGVFGEAEAVDAGLRVFGKEGDEVGEDLRGVSRREGGGRELTSGGRGGVGSAMAWSCICLKRR